MKFNINFYILRKIKKRFNQMFFIPCKTIWPYHLGFTLHIPYMDSYRAYDAEKDLNSLVSTNKNGGDYLVLNGEFKFPKYHKFIPNFILNHYLLKITNEYLYEKYPDIFEWITLNEAEFDLEFYINKKYSYLEGI